jgi:hypothetical protein
MVSLTMRRKLEGGNDKSTAAGIVEEVLAVPAVPLSVDKTQEKETTPSGRFLNRMFMLTKPGAVVSVIRKSGLTPQDKRSLPRGGSLADGSFRLD